MFFQNRNLAIRNLPRPVMPDLGQGGRRLGRGFVLEHGPRVGIGHERFEKVEDYFSRHGGKTIFIGRWIGLVRALAPLSEPLEFSALEWHIHNLRRKIGSARIGTLRGVGYWLECT